MIKIKGKKLPLEETYTWKVLEDDGTFWHCQSHQVIFEPGEKVYINGRGYLKCPLFGCNKYGLSNGPMKWWEKEFELEKVTSSIELVIPDQEKKSFFEKLLNIFNK